MAQPVSDPSRPSSVFDGAAALGRRVQQAWNAADRNEHAFPDIAFDAVGDDPPPAFRMDDVAPFLLRTQVPQPFTDRVFSDMPIVVHRGDGFYIEVLVWVDGTTTIHQHGFSGAFRLLHGSSLHSIYRFEEQRRINSRVRTGRIRCTEMRCLAAGDRHRIRSGPDGLIHALFHLDRPSVTLVIRTDGDPEAGPQLSLFPPGLAVDAQASDQLDAPLRRWVSVLATLAKMDARVNLGRLLVDGLFDLDFGRFAQFALAHPEVGALLDSPTVWEQALHQPSAGRRRLTARYGEDLAEHLLRAVDEARRRNAIGELRQAITDPELRFFLALMLNGRSRRQVFDAVRERHPGGDPAAICAAAIEALAETAGEAGSDQLAQRAPWLEQLRSILGGAGRLAQAVTRRAAAGETPPDLAAADRPAVEAAAARIVDLPVFQALRAPRKNW